MINKCKHFKDGCILGGKPMLCFYTADPQACPNYEEETTGPYHTPSAVVEQRDASGGFGVSATEDKQERVKELQSTIIENTKMSLRLGEAIEKLPESTTRNELIKRHEGVVIALANMESEIIIRDMHACLYGFVDSCTEPSRGLTTCSKCQHAADWLKAEEEDGEL